MQKTDADIDRRLRGRTYVAGVGVQKAGTTWLYDYLASHPDIYMAKRKELHFFDSRFGAKANKIGPMIIRQLKRQLAAIDDKGPVHYCEKLRELMDLARMQYDDEGYSGYFASRTGDRRLFGEITPAYALIGEQGFSYMRSLFPRVKIIYLMRDPVDRHYSMMRMAEEDRSEPGFAIRGFLDTLDRPFGRNMADYPAHIEALRKVFRPDELFFGFYETLFSETQIRRLCAFLDVPFMPAAYSVRVNTSGTRCELDDDLIGKARKKLAPVYDYCRQNLSDIPAQWRA